MIVDVRQIGAQNPLPSVKPFILSSKPQINRPCFYEGVDDGLHLSNLQNTIAVIVVLELTGQSCYPKEKSLMVDLTTGMYYVADRRKSSLLR